MMTRKTLTAAKKKRPAIASITKKSKVPTKKKSKTVAKAIKKQQITQRAIPIKKKNAIKRTTSAVQAEPYPVGSKQWVLHREGFPCQAEIIEIRTKPTNISNNNMGITSLRERKRSMSFASPSSSKASVINLVSASTPKQYYVHFCNFDKRLDEWIDIDRFVSLAQMKRSASTLDSTNITTPKIMTRELRKRLSNSNTPGTSSLMTQLLDPALQQLEREHDLVTKVKNIQMIQLGKWEVDCWYFSPYPDEYSEVDKLFICEKCLKYMKHPETLIHHMPMCDHLMPPGTLIYLKDSIAVFEMSGEKQKLYCQNLCLMAKLFLDHKTLYYDVSPFMFYVLYEMDSDGTHLAGYFSKEKESFDDYNLACIMILPPYQRKGYGRFLIQLSYELTKLEGKIGSPEKPLSDLGAVSYKSFWAFELLSLLKGKKRINLEEIQKETAFKKEDIVDTLVDIGLIAKNSKNLDLKTPLSINTKLINEKLLAFTHKKLTLMDPSCLLWPPKKGTKGRKRTNSKQWLMENYNPKGIAIRLPTFEPMLSLSVKK